MNMKGISQRQHQQSNVVKNSVKSDTSITCVARIYRVQNFKKNTEFLIRAKRVLSEEITKKLLHEDMELKTFLSYYDLIPVGKVPQSEALFPDPERMKEEKDQQVFNAFFDSEESEEKEKKEEEKEAKEGHPTHPTLAKWLKMNQRTYLIKTELPERFHMRDFVDAVVKRNYSKRDAEKMWKSTITYLKQRNKVRTFGTGQKRDTKYEYIKDIQPEEMTEEDMRKLNEGLTVHLGSIK